MRPVAAIVSVVSVAVLLALGVGVSVGSVVGWPGLVEQAAARAIAAATVETLVHLATDKR